MAQCGVQRSLRAGPSVMTESETYKIYAFCSDATDTCGLEPAGTVFSTSTFYAGARGIATSEPHLLGGQMCIVMLSLLR